MGISRHMLTERYAYLASQGYVQMYGYTSHSAMKKIGNFLDAVVVDIVYTKDQNGKPYEIELWAVKIDSAIKKFNSWDKLKKQPVAKL